MTTLTQLAFHLENFAEWRRELADDHPNDVRYADAAARLSRIAAELPALEASKAHRGLVVAWEKVAGSPDLAEAEEEIVGTVGFSVLPTAAEFLRALIDRLEQEAAVAR